MSELISIKQLSKSYKKKHVLKGIDISVSEGQILGLVGPNGAGKTTCLHALLGLTSFEGEIDILGCNPKGNRERMLNQVAYISDVAVLPKWMTGLQALDYVQGIHPKFNRQKAEGFLAKTNINPKDKIKALSKGMVTQLHLALILAIDAKVLVLDEPTLGLDALTRRQFYTHLLEDFYDETKCIVITTHQIEEIENILTDVAFIKEGELALVESVDAIRNRFKLLAVPNENLSQAAAYNPLYSNKMMGMTSMLFDGVHEQELAELGQISSPSLADIFVGVMTQETQL
ncbi:ABC transporter ATP-binding protein [Paraglaciecola sp.]|uniref:ABC transporter ATP-binding protein n=1 Tax=Paraglaciecola sp. TaxID=1920173 RepID=UPI003EF2C40A